MLRIDENTPTPRGVPQAARARGTNVPSVRSNAGADAPVRRTMWVQSRAVDLTGNRVRLDLTTPLEATLGFLAIMAFMLAFGLGTDAQGKPALLAGILGAFLGFVWMQTDCTYILNNADRTLDYQREVLGLCQEWPVAAFQDILVVTTKGTFHSSKHGSWWEYRPVAILENGTVLELTDSVRNDVGMADDNARAFARHVGARHVPGQAHQELSVTWVQGSPVVTHRPRRGLFGLLFD